MSRDWRLNLRIDNRICHVQANKIVHEELEQETEYLHKLRIVQKCNLNNCCDHSWMEDVDIDNTQYLETLVHIGYELAVIWFDGSWPTSPEFEERLLEYHDGEWQDKNWMCAGHIINKPDRYPHWHHQCIVVNLKAWAEDEYPKLNKYANKKNAGFVASAECIHDDYTPLELVPDKSRDLRSLGSREDWGDRFIHYCLGSGYSVLNLPEAVREHKVCIYPEDDIEATKEWLLDPNFVDGKTQEELYSYGFNLPEDKLELWGYKIQHIQVLYVTNTETVPKECPQPGFTVMAVPCSGLHQFWHIAQALDTLKRVIWFDFNPHAIAWTKLVLEEWDGVDFDSFYKANIHRITDNSVISPECVIYEQDLVNEFINRMGDDWVNTFNRIKKLDHEFTCVNAVKNWDLLADVIGNNETVFLQVTNIWQYESNYLNTEKFVAQRAFIDLLSTILNSNKDLYVTGDTPGGNYLEYQNVKLMTGIY